MQTSLAHRARRALGRAMAAGTVLTLAVGVIGTPAQDQPQTEGEDHLLARGSVAKGFDRRTDVSGSEMVGVTWKGDADVTISVRALDPEGQWTSWVELHGEVDDGPDAASAEHRSRRGAGPVWLGHDMVEIETRVDAGTVSDLQMHAIDTEAAPPPGPFDVSPAEAAPGSPLVVTRAQWQADESWRNIGNPGCTGQPSYASGVRTAIVHHTAGSNAYAPADVPAILRGIYYFHTHDRGWCDVAYNFFVDRFGRGFEGRFGGIDRAVIGGHAGGFNTGSTGVALIGDFEQSTVPSAAYSSLRGLLAWKLAYHGVDPQGTSVVTAGDAPSSRYPPGTAVEVSNVGGHRDTNLTGCPGRHLYALLPQLRRDLAADVAAVRDQRISCDWDGDGVDTPGYFYRGMFYLRSSNTSSASTTAFGFGNPTDVAVCGDWDGNGTDTVGVVRNGAWYLRQHNSTGPADLAFGFGDPTDRPVVGDWDGSGADSPGVFRSGRWYLTNRVGSPWHDLLIGYGDPGDVPIVGDWDGVGADGIGVFRRGAWFLTNNIHNGAAEVAPFGYGNPTDQPLAGDWDGDGDDTAGVARGSFWYLSNQLRAASAEVTFAF